MRSGEAAGMRTGIQELKATTAVAQNRSGFALKNNMPEQSDVSMGIFRRGVNSRAGLIMTVWWKKKQNKNNSLCKVQTVKHVWETLSIY